MPQFPHLYSGEEEDFHCTGLFKEDQTRALPTVLDALAIVIITNVIQYRQARTEARKLAKGPPAALGEKDEP